MYPAAAWAEVTRFSGGRGTAAGASRARNRSMGGGPPAPDRPRQELVRGAIDPPRLHVAAILEVFVSEEGAQGGSGGRSQGGLLDVVAVTKPIHAPSEP